MVAISLATQFNMDMNSTYFEVSQEASQIYGTSAQLQKGQRLKIIDLLYGLMLPSGNDAALVLAENFGMKLQKV